MSTTTRKLAAIMFTDIVGYTTLMGSDEKEALRVVEVNKHNHLKYFKKHNGLLIKPLGDGILASFDSSVEAVQCAIELQKHIQKNETYQIRIGIHQGDILFKEKDIFGDGVNIASRIEPIAAPGGICITGEIADAIRSSGIKTKYIGEKELKNAGSRKIWAVAETGLPIPVGFMEEKINHIPNNLPQASTSFIGREKELTTVMELVDEHRLVTLTGAGGSGKTRLALEAGRRLLNEFADGVWFVDLSQISNPEIVLQFVSQVLQIKEETDMAQQDAIIHAISNKNMMIVLDNCEHVIEPCAELASQLLKRTSSPKILSTSREVLNINGEHVWLVPQLSYPEKSIYNVKLASSYESINLLCERATEINYDFNLNDGNITYISDICRQLEGVPLALELAASRMNVLLPETISQLLHENFQILKSQIRDMSPRQRTISATINWSFNLLSEDEKVLLKRLSVFAGGFDIPSAEIICGFEPLDKANVLDLLHQLINKSLIILIKRNTGTQRFNQLEIIRQFAQDQFKHEEELNELIERFYQYFLKTAEKAYYNQYRETSKWVKILNQEHSNCLRALDYMQGDNEKQLLMAGYLAWYWFASSHLLLGMEYLKKPLADYHEKGDIRARALFGLGEVLYWVSSEGLNYLDQALLAYRETDNLFDLAKASLFRGGCYNLYDHTLGYEDMKKGLEVAEKTGDSYLIVHCRTYFYFYYISPADPDKAMYIEPFFEKNREEARKLGMDFYVYLNQHELADCALIKGDGKEAEKRYIDGLKYNKKMNSIWHLAAEIFMLSMGLALQERHPKALRLYHAGLHRIKELKVDIFHGHFVRKVHERIMEPLFARFDKNMLEKYKNEGLEMSLDEAVEYAINSELD